MVEVMLRGGRKRGVTLISLVWRGVTGLGGHVTSVGLVTWFVARDL